ncbi:expressed unknown protein [Seminavis robusta]|uniref:Uncharacterized protein n=1 Tax=Seminavis robusta TaxID=568900 RepID=A0A9N8EEZ4_9STRA|nr:expressed unknown protein [Seminavis robusta]|eukprot:Sro896_g217290.1 n/a (167) ;mRNA; r:5722-6222
MSPSDITNMTLYVPGMGVIPSSATSGRPSKNSRRDSSSSFSWRSSCSSSLTTSSTSNGLWEQQQQQEDCSSSSSELSWSDHSNPDCAATLVRQVRKSAPACVPFIVPGIGLVPVPKLTRSSSAGSSCSNHTNGRQQHKLDFRRRSVDRASSWRSCRSVPSMETVVE